MSEEQHLQLTTLIDKEVEKKRLTAWGGLGVSIYHSELKFQLVGQSIEAKLIIPLTSEQITESETALATVKKELKALVEDRIQITARFDPVTARLMAPEKSVLAAIKANETEIIKAKLKREQEAKTTENKNKELVQVAEKVRIYVADMHAAYLNAQVKLISDSYEHALKIKITEEALPEYLNKIKARINPTNRATPKLKITAVYNSQEDIDNEITKHFKPWSAQQYIDGFVIDIDKKYEDWALALKNPEVAEDLNKKEATETVEAINDNKESEIIGAKLESIAAPIDESPVKELKRPYKVKEPDTIAEAFMIINAFTVNRKLTEPQLSRIKPINLSVKQMISALESIKNDDENFSCTGVIFSQIEKL